MAHAIGITVGWLLVQLAVAGAAEARERVALPFSCAVDNGRVRVDPSSEQIYPIVGARDQQPFTYCTPGQNGHCRTWMLHRFVVQCAGGRVPWPEVVAAAGRERGRLIMDGGQLLLQLGPRRGPRDASCAEAERGAKVNLVRWMECQLASNGSGRGGVRTRILALPRGYAPLALIGGRIQIDADLTPLRAQPDRVAAIEPALAAPPPPQIKPLPTQPAPLPPPIEAAMDAIPDFSEPSTAMPSRVFAEDLALPVEQPPVTAYAVAGIGQPAALTAAWSARLDPDPAAQARTDGASARSSFQSLFVLMLVATTLMLIAGVAISRRTPKVVWRAVGGGEPGPDAGDSPRALALQSKAEGHIAEIERALVRLSTVTPLRNALARDMQSSQRRLAVVMQATSAVQTASADDWSRARRRLERITQDLDRLQQIANGAVSSMSGLNAARTLPRDLDEAYATLGVRPGVSEAIVKKLVEALRVSWHPDLAISEEDRAARDIRIKEINVAWDLITGKRESE